MEIEKLFLGKESKEREGGNENRIMVLKEMRLHYRIAQSGLNLKLFTLQIDSRPWLSLPTS